MPLVEIVHDIVELGDEALSTPVNTVHVLEEVVPVQLLPSI